MSFNSVKLDVLQDLYLNFELTQRQLCLIFGVSIRTVGRQLDKLGIKRTISEAIKLSWKHGNRRYNPNSIRRGSKSSNWKGGRVYMNGYVKILVGKHPLANSNGYVLEHRLIWFNNHPEDIIRASNIIVHHFNGIRDDNRIENLIGLPKTKHINMFPNTLVRELQKKIIELERR